MFTRLGRPAGRRAPRDRGRKQPRCRPGVEPLEGRCLLSGNVVLRWNELLLQAARTAPPSPAPLFRNLALTHVAIFDAANAVEMAYTPYSPWVTAWPGASAEAAAAQAAHDTLVELYPHNRAAFDAALAADLDGIPAGRAKDFGTIIGQHVARHTLFARAFDGTNRVLSYTPPNTNPGQWQPTAPDFTPAANVHVPFITPFAVASASQFRPPPPPALTSPEYAADFNEAKSLGSLTSTTRTADQTQVALLWRTGINIFSAWNGIARDMAEARSTPLVESARLFALMSMAVNDGLETSFGSKFHYVLWRPITAIRRADEDGNPATVADPAWTTLHPTTPPYPTYAGNAATIGAASATTLASFFGSDAVPFQVRWDAYGFPGVTRSYAGFGQAAQELADSRIYGGIHFRFDSVAGQGIGTQVARHVSANYLLPAGRPASRAGLTPSAAPRAADDAATAGTVIGGLLAAAGPEEPALPSAESVPARGTAARPAPVAWPANEALFDAPVLPSVSRPEAVNAPSWLTPETSWQEALDEFFALAP